MIPSQDNLFNSQSNNNNLFGSLQNSIFDSRHKKEEKVVENNGMRLRQTSSFDCLK